MVKPLRVVLLLAYIAIILAVTLYILPSEWKITSSLTLHSFTLRSIFEKQEANYSDISDITARFTSTGRDTVLITHTANQTHSNKRKTERIAADSLEEQYRIQYGEGGDTALFSFFNSLQTLSRSNKLIRVLHYGDSQIEGDRITSFLRNKLQEQFGGCGVGLIPILDPVGQRSSIKIESGFPWQKIFVYGNGYNKANPSYYGLLGSYYKYTFRYASESPGNDSLTASSDTAQLQPVYSYKKWQNVSVTLLPNSNANAHPLENKFERIRLFYRNAETPFELSIYTPTDTIDRLRIEPDSTRLYHTYEYRFRGHFEQVKFTFGSSRSPELYGMALDCNKGIAVDNIPFRGSSGIEFTRMNREILKQQIKALNVKLIILQFGVNVVPYIAQDYSYYEQQFYSQLKLLKSIAPDVSILVVGVSDMSRKEGELYVSYPNIEKIRDAQKRAAHQAGCAFWDLYKAMGGKNSMPSWVMAKPALANKDFTHFTPKGALLVSEMLYKAIQSEYEKFNGI